MRIGFIVNPIAGMGGSVGLKGTDEDMCIKAAELGAVPTSPKRAMRFLRKLVQEINIADVEFYVAAKTMGEYEMKNLDVKHVTVGEVQERTRAEDTVKSARAMAEIPVDLLVFVGGDGTARDILSAIDRKLPILGIPAGVKMYSACFATDPETAARLVAKFVKNGLPLCEMEVLDIDENLYRKNQLQIKLYDCALTPYEPMLIQSAKSPSTADDDERDNQLAVARYFAESIQPETLYILGPGTTIEQVGHILRIDKTLLGVDIVFNNQLIVRDAGEKEILDALDKFKGYKAKVVVTPIGSQGFILGRGNQQISGEVIRRVGVENIIVLATHRKLSITPVLRVDIGEPDLDREIKRVKFIRVIVDYYEERMVKII